MVDQHGDNHGYMMLRIPVNKLTGGKTFTLKVTGSKANLTSWYMTFKKAVKTGVTLNPFPGNNQKRRLLRCSLLRQGSFTLDSRLMQKSMPTENFLKTQLLSLDTILSILVLPPVSKPTKIELKVVAGDFSVKNIVTLDPVKKWNIKFIQHSHTDIGYTRSQTDILAEHLRYIDYALDYCDATDNYPENAKFRWTCEASWPVDEYLKCSPASQIERLLKRIKEGRIEVTGMYFNFDEIPDEKILAASLAGISEG